MRMYTAVLMTMSLLISTASFGELKRISDQSLKSANEYFYSKVARLLFDGSAMQQTSKDIFGVEPLLLGSQRIAADVTQTAYMIPSTDFILITINFRKGSETPFTVAVTRYVSEIPYEEIVYQAYDSKKKNGRRTFYIGDEAHGESKLRHLLEYAEQPERMATWMYVITE